MKLEPQHWQVSPCTPADVGFIIDSWCADEHVKVSREIGEDPEVFKVGQRRRVVRLIQSCTCVALRPTPEYWASVGAAPNPHELFAWICYSLDRATLRPIIHFVYVKPESHAKVPLRSCGLASALLHIAGVRPEKAAWATSKRHALRRAAEKRGIIYNRFLLDYDPAAKPPRWNYP